MMAPANRKLADGPIDKTATFSLNSKFGPGNQELPPDFCSAGSESSFIELDSAFAREPAPSLFQRQTPDQQPLVS